MCKFQYQREVPNGLIIVIVTKENPQEICHCKLYIFFFFELSVSACCSENCLEFFAT